MVLQEGFVTSEIVFGCDISTYNPIPVQELSLLSRNSGILQPCILNFGEAMLGNQACHLTYNHGPYNS